MGVIMTFRTLSIAFALSAPALAGCQTAGFSLPPGDSSRGKEAFIKFQCSDCHTLTGMKDLRQGIKPLMTLPLGGKTERVKTYEELVTSIINPSHVISPNFPGEKVSAAGRSKMPNYNSVMTVSELVDLVTFLQGQYELAPYEFTEYGDFVYPSDW